MSVHVAGWIVEWESFVEAWREWQVPEEVLDDARPMKLRETSLKPHIGAADLLNFPEAEALRDFVYLVIGECDHGVNDLGDPEALKPGAFHHVLGPSSIADWRDRLANPSPDAIHARLAEAGVSAPEADLVRLLHSQWLELFVGLDGKGLGLALRVE